MRKAGQLAAELLDEIGPYVKPGVTTAELDRVCAEMDAAECNAFLRGNAIACYGLERFGIAA